MYFSKYDELGAYHWSEYDKDTIYKKHVDHLLSLINPTSNDKILDIGAGDGLITHKINEIVNNCCFGIDDNRKAVGLAKKKNSNVEIGDAYGLSCQDNFYTKILMGDVIEHLKNPKAALKEVYRVLKDDGFLFLATPPARADGKLQDKFHYKEYTSNELTKELKSCGFDLHGKIETKHHRMYAVFSKNKFYQNVYTCISDNYDKTRKDSINLIPPSSQFKHSRMNAKIVKILSHLYIPREWSIWVDGNIYLKVEPEYLLDMMIMSGKDIAVFEHPQRANIYTEAVACINEKKDDPKIITKQLKRYEGEGFNDQKLAMCGILIRRHTPEICRLNEQWWAEICKGSWRDQLSFPYVFREKVHYFPKVNMVDNKYFIINNHIKANHIKANV